MVGNAGADPLLRRAGNAGVYPLLRQAGNEGVDPRLQQGETGRVREVVFGSNLEPIWIPEPNS